MLRIVALFAALTVFPVGTSRALTLELPASSKPLAHSQSAADTYVLPTGPFDDGVLPGNALEGAVLRQSWQVVSQGLTSLQLFAPLREQLEDAGYRILFECGGAECGGFDFRFATEVLPAPDMHVDLTDFRFLAASDGAQDHLSLLVSRSSNAGYIQLIRVTPSETSAKIETAAPAQITAPTPTATPEGSVEANLTQFGHAILRDLTFETGAAALGPGPFLSLQSLADFLLADPNRKIALVGHTDAVGTLENNVALSKRRAAAVLERLVGNYGVPRSQLEAEGMGYLSPVAPNQTSEGREANRRVEVILRNTQ